MKIKFTLIAKTTKITEGKETLESNNVQDLVSGVNKRHKYKGEISYFAEKCGVPANTVEVFNTEYDAKLFICFIRDTI